jgi:multicomponent Na+:H+ antiporter subunit G
MSNRELTVLILIAVGTAFMVISAIGIVRLPDVFARMHAAGKASTLGVSCILLGAGWYFGGGEMVRAIALIVLFYVTAPISTTAMARAAYRFTAHSQFYLNRNEMDDPEYQHDRPRATPSDPR